MQLVITPPGGDARQLEWRKEQRHMNDGWKWWEMSGADCCDWALALRHLDGCRSLLSVCLLLRPNEEKCKNQSMCLRKESAESLAGSPCWPLLKNEGKSKLIIILKACPGDAFCCDTSICQSFEDPPPPDKYFQGSKRSLVKHY